MKITKIGHCCLVIETRGVKIMTDPGSFSSAQNDVTGVDAVIITHEHGDHLHVESLAAVLKKNPGALVISNSAVAKILAEKGIACAVIEGTAQGDVKGVTIEACDAKHEEIYEDIGQVQNTGYFIDTVFYPGDAYGNPGKPVNILALPVAGPWCKLADAIRYALRVKPAKAFPVHDAVLAPGIIGFVHMLPQQILGSAGTKFIPLKQGESAEF